MSQAYTAGDREIHLWAIGAMAEYMLYVAFNALIQPIFTTGFGLSPVLVGWALMLPRVTDALVDPLVGHASDHLRTPWGRRRPFLFFTTLLGAATMIAMWWTPRSWNPSLQFAALLSSSTLLYFCYGTFGMMHAALGFELSDDFHLRSRVVAVRGFYFSIAALCGGWMYWLALRPVFRDEVAGIRMISIGIAGVILIAGLIPTFNCTERFQNVSRPHVPLGRAVKTTLRNRPFVIVLLLRIAQTFGLSFYGAMAFFIGVFSVFHGDKAAFTLLSGLSGMVGVVCSFALMPVSASLSRTLGKRRGLILSFGATFVCSLALPFLSNPRHPYLLLIYMLAIIPANLVMAMFLSAIMPDICDIDELESGERREGLFAAVNGFVSKLENSLVILASGYALKFAGFDAQRPQQLPEVLEKLRWLGFAPAMFFSGLAFAIACFVPITEELMTQVRSTLDSRAGGHIFQPKTIKNTCGSAIGVASHSIA